MAQQESSAPYNLTLTDDDAARLQPGMKVRIPTVNVVVRIDRVDRTPNRDAPARAYCVTELLPRRSVVVNIRPEGWPYHDGKERPAWYRGFPAIPLSDLLR